MKNPYEVLEVSKDASQEEIKLAYKKLIKKYHPDQYANNPLADLAQEKIKEINEAYDSLSKQGNSSSKNTGRQYEHNTNTQKSNSYEYHDIRKNIELNNLMLAEQMLDRMGNRNAEWNYLKGVVALKKGWYDQALRYITVAASLEPTNMEYRNTLNNLNTRNASYREYGNFRGYNDNTLCRVCGGLLVTDCCCGCLGVDLIRCC